MKFMEAEEKLAKIANGEYHGVYYELITHPDGERETRVALYIHPSIHSRYHKTYEEAFKELEKIMNPKLKINEELPEDAPEP